MLEFYPSLLVYSEQLGKTGKIDNEIFKKEFKISEKTNLPIHEMSQLFIITQSNIITILNKM